MTIRPSIARPLWLAFAALALAHPCAARGYTDKPYDPFKVPKPVFAERVRVIAIGRTWISPVAKDIPGLREFLEQQFAHTLESRGYRIVPSTAHRDQWLQMSTRLGGTFNPLTGARLSTEFDLVAEHVGRELQRLFEVDAVLDIVVSIQSLTPTNDRKKWIQMGGPDPLTWRGEPMKSGFGRPELVTGPHLGIRITDVTGTELYNVQVPVTWYKAYAFQNYEQRTVQAAFSDFHRFEGAMHRVLGALHEVAPKPVETPSNTPSNTP